MSPINRLIPIREALPVLGVKLTRAYGLVKTGELRAVKVGRSTLISESEIARFQAGLPEWRPSGHPAKAAPAASKAA